VLHTQRTTNAEHKRMSTQFTKVEKERDKAQEEVVNLTERVTISKKQVEEVTKRSQDAEKEVASLTQRVTFAEQKVKDLEKELFVNSKKHQWVSVASALGMDNMQTKRMQYLAKHMHDTKSEDWKDSMSRKSDLVTRLPAAVCLLLEKLFSCVRVNKKTVPVTDILRYVYQQEICDKVRSDTALKEIRKAVRSAVRTKNKMCSVTRSCSHSHPLIKFRYRNDGWGMPKYC